jgi:tetratricopeptide (TPR) repeat protein
MNGENQSPGSKTDRLRRMTVRPTSPAAGISASGSSPKERRDSAVQAGLSRFQSGDLTQAIAIWEKVLEEFPKDAEALRLIEEARSRKQARELASMEGAQAGLPDWSFQEAREAASEPVSAAAPGQAEEEAGSVEALFRKGEALYHQGGYREARDLFERVLAQQPAHPDAYFLLELSKAREADQRELQDLELTAERLYNDGDYEGSMREWKRVIESQPTNAKAKQMYEAAKEAAAGGEIWVPQKLPAAGAADARKPVVPKAKVVGQTAPAPPAGRTPEAAAQGKARPPGQESTQRLRAPVLAAGQLRPGGRGRPPQTEEPTEDRVPAFNLPDSPGVATVPSASATPVDEATAKRTLRELFDSASKAERDGELDRALDLYRKIQGIAPHNEVAQERISSLEMMLQSRKFKLAFDALSKAKALAQREPARAILEVRRALQLRPEMEEALKMQAELQKALTHRSILRTRPMLLPWLGGIAVFVIVALWLVFGVVRPQIQEHRVTGLLNAASRALQQGRYSEAEDKIMEARAMSPRSQDVRRVHGRLLLAKGDAKGAAETLRGLVQHGVGSAQDRFLLATALARSGRDGEAQVLLQELIAEDQSFHNARREYAWLMIRQGKLAAASDQSNALLVAQPEEPENAVLAAAIFEKTGMDREALEQLDKAFKLGLREREFVQRYLDLLMKNNHLDEAQLLLAESKNAFPDEVQYRLTQASLARRRNRLDDAEEAYRKALYMADTNEEAGYGLAEVLVAKRDLRAAQKVLSGFATRTEPSGRILALLGDTYMALDSPVQALDSYRRAQQLDPSLPNISQKVERALRATRR